LSQQLMQDDDQKSPANWFDRACEIVFLTAMAIGVWVGGTLLLAKLLAKPIANYMPLWFLDRPFFFCILAFDAVWIIGMKLWRPKNVTINTIKKMVFVSVLALSASVLTHWSILKLFDKTMH
jgi:hypothetical protein